MRVVDLVSIGITTTITLAAGAWHSFADLRDPMVILFGLQAIAAAWVVLGVVNALQGHRGRSW